MNVIKKIIFSLFLISTSQVCYPLETIKLAILDNFKYQKYVTTKYKDYYIEGVAVAINEARKRGISIEYKVFQYNQEPLSIINKIPALLAWNPDVIIGPRDSNKFLMLGPYIKDTLTISPFATSLSISKMPGNFFSITLSDLFEAKAIYDFVDQKFPKKDLVVLTEADCKSCMDVSGQIINMWSENKKITPKQKYFISQQITTLALDEIIKKNDTNKIFLLADNAHSSAVLMARITSLSDKKSTFVGGDGWGSWEDTEVGKLGNTENYSAYHILPWGLEMCGKDMRIFQKKYKKIFSDNPKNKLSFIAYQAVMSFVSSYKQYGDSLAALSTKQKLLLSYKKALSKNKNWYKPTNYLVYKISKNKNFVYTTVNPLTNRLLNYNCHKNEK